MFWAKVLLEAIRLPSLHKAPPPASPPDVPGELSIPPEDPPIPPMAVLLEKMQLTKVAEPDVFTAPPSPTPPDGNGEPKNPVPIEPPTAEFPQKEMFDPVTVPAL
jgi:hypothetical protein